MKRLLVFALLLSCTQQEKPSNTERKMYVMLPNGSHLMCVSTWEFHAMVSLKDCIPAAGRWELSGDIECSHGACWKDE